MCEGVFSWTIVDIRQVAVPTESVFDGVCLQAVSPFKLMNVGGLLAFVKASWQPLVMVCTAIMYGIQAGGLLHWQDSLLKGACFRRAYVAWPQGLQWRVFWNGHGVSIFQHLKVSGVQCKPLWPLQ
jgi:hypothetical protein